MSTEYEGRDVEADDRRRGVGKCYINYSKIVHHVAQDRLAAMNIWGKID
jgi:hypothetical protein